MKDSNLGIIRSVRGTVVDILFSQRMPDIYSRLVTGNDSAIEIEVINHPNDVVRDTALTRPLVLSARCDLARYERAVQSSSEGTSTRADAERIWKHDRRQAFLEGRERHFME